MFPILNAPKKLEFTSAIVMWLRTQSFIANSMEHSPSWEANSPSATQEIPYILWNPRAHYCIHKCPPSVPILSQINPVPAFSSHVLRNHFNIIFPSAPRFPSGLFPSDLPTKTLHFSCLHTCHMPHPSHSFWFHPLNNIWQAHTHTHGAYVTRAVTAPYDTLTHQSGRGAEASNVRDVQ